MGGGGYGMPMGTGNPYAPPTLEQLNEQKANFEMVLDQFNQIRSQINNPQANSPLACGEQSTCSFREVCKDMQKNRNSMVLYRNSKGEETTSFRRLQLEQQINFCVNNNLQLLQSVETHRTQMLSSLELQTKWTETFSTQQKTSINLQKKLSETILKNQDSEKYQQVQVAMQELILELPTQNGDGWQPKEMLEKAQQRAGIQLSKDTIEAIVALNESSGVYSAYGMGGLYQNPVVPQQVAAAPLSTENPFFEPELTTNPYYAGSVEKMNAYKVQVEQQSRRAKSLFADAKKLAIQALSSHKNNANKARIDNMILRLDSVTFEIAPATASACRIPNAYYSSSRHRISLCPLSLTSPEGGLLGTLSHELGHAVDPCNLAKDLIKDEKGTYTVLQSESNIKEVGKFQTIANGIHYDQNPLGGVLTCLQNEDSSLGAIIGSPQDRMRFRKEMADAIEGSGGEKPELLDEKTQNAQLKKYRACTAPAEASRSQMQEGFSDWLRGEAVKLKIKNEANPLRRKELAYEAISHFANLNCIGLNPELPEATEVALEKLGCSYSNHTLIAFLPDDEHSPTYKRVNNILLAIPEIADAVGCKTTPGMVHCE